jgi:hypothetical protein
LLIAGETLEFKGERCKAVPVGGAGTPVLPRSNVLEVLLQIVRQVNFRNKGDRGKDVMDSRTASNFDHAALRLDPTVMTDEKIKDCLFVRRWAVGIKGKQIVS